MLYVNLPFGLGDLRGIVVAKKDWEILIAVSNKSRRDWEKEDEDHQVHNAIQPYDKLEAWLSRAKALVGVLLFDAGRLQRRRALRMGVRAVSAVRNSEEIRERFMKKELQARAGFEPW
jgi:hypothetical protein